MEEDKRCPQCDKLMVDAKFESVTFCWEGGRMMFICDCGFKIEKGFTATEDMINILNVLKKNYHSVLKANEIGILS